MTNTTTPRETDEKLAGLYDEMGKVASQMTSVASRAHKALGERFGYEGTRRAWPTTDTVAIEKLRAVASAHQGEVSEFLHSHPVNIIAAVDKLAAQGKALAAQIQALDDIYRANPWTRYFPCLTRDGHIHSTLRGCSSVRWDTAMGWTPELSGKPVEAAVGELGEALCTKCYPDAPVAWTAKNLGQVKDERTRTEREAAKAEREAAKYAKRLLDSEVFKVSLGRFGERIETVAACKDALRREVEFRDYYGNGEHRDHAGWAEGAEQAKRVLLARERRLAGTGATQEEIDRIIESAVRKNRKEGARI